MGVVDKNNERSQAGGAPSSATDKVSVSPDMQRKIDELMKPAVDQSYAVRRSALSATAQDRGGAWVADPFQNPQWFSAETYSLLGSEGYSLISSPERPRSLRKLARAVLDDLKAEVDARGENSASSDDSGGSAPAARAAG